MVELPLPTQTAVLTCGVKPTIHASLLPLWYLPAWMPSVPVFAADGRPPASGTPDHVGDRLEGRA